MPNTKIGGALLSIVLWTWGGTTYFFMEVAYKSFTGHPERISWTMLALAIVICAIIERCGNEFPWEMSLLKQATICTAIITASELLAGCALNIALGLNVWDYSHLPGNVLGQICPQFTTLWFAIVLAFIPAFDWIRWAIIGGQRPTYRLFRANRA